VPRLLAAYPRADGRYDEMLAEARTPRAHWARLYETLRAAEPDRVRDRIASIERGIRDSGITYNMYADPKGAERPWTLDALPLIIPPAEWSVIESAIAQRAKLLNAVLADVYGPQQLLAEGEVPTGLVLGHSGYHRPARGADIPGGVALFVYAADLARAPDGRWWVVADRTQAPSGAGYAIENRLIVSRVFPGLFRELRAQRLAGFFAALRESLAHFSPRGDGQGLTVLLTPGPYNETYHEHTLLARYLGFTLAEGSDLTVRDGKVWLKTVEGLNRVHAILRRQDDDFCDPLELRADSALGVPGLIECARRGTVLIANAIGSGVLESGALMGFLPRLCERLLGEPLRMPSIATWWLGEAAALSDALPRLRDLVFKPADPILRQEPVFGQDLDARQVRALVARIRRQPEAWFAQELVRLSQAPVYDARDPRHLGARSVGLRVFAVATRNGYHVMPGGLARVAGTHDARVISMQRGGASKDTWALSAAPVNTSLTLLRSTVGPADLVRSGSDLSSRVAESLFWFGRYAERAEGTARLLRVALPRFAADEEEDRPAQRPLLALARAAGLLEKDETEAVLLAAAFDAERPDSLPAILQNVQRVAYGLRERLSTDNWRTIHRLLQHAAFTARPDLPVALGTLDRTINDLMTLTGFALDGMTRDTGWRFLSVGRRIERIRLVSMAVATATREGRTSGLDWLLEFCDSVITYRSRYMGASEWLPVLDLLVRDDTNPRAVAFMLRGLADFVGRIERAVGAEGAGLLPPVLAGLGPFADAARLTPDGDLPAWLDAVAAGAATLSDRLSLRFFTHADDRALATFAA